MEPGDNPPSAARPTGGDRIEIRGLRATGTHGVLPEEKVRAQPFEVDIDIEMDLRAAGRTDALVDTADYGAVSSAVAAIVEGAHADLLETLAQRVAAATAVIAPAATAVGVTIRKLRPPVPVQLDFAAVTIWRRRDELVD